jgi:hypothetical protein
LPFERALLAASTAALDGDDAALERRARNHEVLATFRICLVTRQIACRMTMLVR